MLRENDNLSEDFRLHKDKKYILNKQNIEKDQKNL